ncbi:ABC transporter permease subunit [Paenibacillus roseipurpureus]|uniref:ABC transporter permease subunit n=2 Tax=Paenibacillus roseopurpureus TaxID=2918901 RepID=A0AA96LUY5_9BACL|nr:ABC transporter permease subunit [Paenibacillus sp. MBLB1832]
MLLPGLVYYILFKYLPMYGIVIAFEKYSVFKGITGSRWVGLKHFQDFFQGPDAWKLIRNTLVLNLYDLAFAFPAPIVLALAFNELRSGLFRRVTQTVSFLPHFISMVVVAGLAVNFLAPSSGIINKLLHEWFGAEPIAFLAKPEYFRGIFVSVNLWKEIGWSSILYLAALSGINPELYEAASIDGAGKLRQAWSVTLPGILPTIMILLILKLGHMLSLGASTIILLYNPSVYETADVISTYVYRRGLVGTDYSFAAAIDLMNSVVGILLIFAANRTSRRLTETSLW